MGNSTSGKVFWDVDNRVSWRAEQKEPVERQTGRLKKRRKKQMKQSSKLTGWYEIKNKSGSDHFRKGEALVFHWKGKKEIRKEIWIEILAKCIEGKEKFVKRGDHIMIVYIFSVEKKVKVIS